MGFNIGGGFNSVLTGNQTAKANNALSKANAAASNKVTQASNAAAAADGNLARFMQSLNNNRALKAGGDALEMNAVNALGNADAQASHNFSDSIKQAERVGHVAAQVATAGVAGGAVDMINQSTALRDSIVRQSIQDSEGSEAYAASRTAGNIMSQMVSSLDSSVLLDQLDYNTAYYQEAPIMGEFARAIQGFFPVQGDAASGFRNLGAGYTKVQQYYSQYKARNYQVTEADNRRELANFNQQSGANRESLDNYDSFDYGSFESSAASYESFGTVDGWA